MKHIEFIGLPGSGKTYVQRHLVERYGDRYRITSHKLHIGQAKLTGLWRKRGLGLLAGTPWRRWKRRRDRKAYHIRSRSEDTRAMLEFARRNPGFVSHVLALLSACDAPSEQKALMAAWMHKLYVDFGWLTSAPAEGGGFMLLDEAFAQKAFALMMHLDLGVEEIRAYALQAPKPDHLVVLDVPETMVRRRLDARGWPGWVQTGDEADRETLIRRCVDVRDVLADAYRECGVDVFFLDNSTEDTGALDQRLASMLEAFAATARR